MKQMYVGLPVKDLNRAVDFYKQLGFDQDKRFRGDDMAQFKLSDALYITLFPMDKMTDTIPLDGLDKNHYQGVTVALSVATREEVDDLVSTAHQVGGEPFKQANEMPFMYMNGFKDLDGHVWTVFAMKM